MCKATNLEPTWGVIHNQSTQKADDLLKKLLLHDLNDPQILQIILDDPWLLSTVLDHQDGLESYTQYLDEANAIAFNSLLSSNKIGYDIPYKYPSATKLEWDSYPYSSRGMSDNDKLFEKFIDMFHDHRVVNYLRNLGLVAID